MYRLNNKVVIITGGATGIGRVAAQLFAKEGARVAVIDRNVPEAGKTVQLIKQEGGEALHSAADVSKASQVEAMVSNVLDQFGAIDVLVNNAGILIRTHPVHELTEMEWDLTFDTNLRGMFLCCKYVIPHMLHQGGAVINVSSEAGMRGSVDWPAYGASKAGVIQFTRTVAMTYAKNQVRANVIVPGLIDTPQARGSTGSTEAFMQATSQIPLGRAGKPEDVANLMLFLASDESSYITGTGFVIDGGGSA